MMKIAVVYGSKRGTAERYARYIAEETDADLFSYKQIRAKDLADYDIIVYGGGIYSGGIRGLDFIRKNIRRKFRSKRIICFAVGISVESEENRRQCTEINFDKRLKGLECYYFPGAYDPKTVSGLDKKLMGVTRKMIEGGVSTVDGKRLLDYIDHGCDLVNLAKADPLIRELRSLKDEAGGSDIHLKKENASIRE